MDPTIFAQAMGEYVSRLGSLTLVWQLVWEKENSEFKPVTLRLKIDLMSYPARVEELVNTYTYKPTHMPTHTYI